MSAQMKIITVLDIFLLESLSAPSPERHEYRPRQGRRIERCMLIHPRGRPRRRIRARPNQRGHSASQVRTCPGRESKLGSLRAFHLPFPVPPTPMSSPSTGAANCGELRRRTGGVPERRGGIKTVQLNCKVLLPPRYFHAHAHAFRIHLMFETKPLECIVRELRLGHVPHLAAFRPPIDPCVRKWVDHPAIVSNDNGPHTFVYPEAQRYDSWDGNRVARLGKTKWPPILEADQAKKPAHGHVVSNARTT